MDSNESFEYAEEQKKSNGKVSSSYLVAIEEFYLFYSLEQMF